MNLRDRELIYNSPLYHFDAYGLNNPMVQECIRLGAYDPCVCADCKGAGWIGEEDTEIGPVKSACRHCGGSGVHEAKGMTTVLTTDFLTPQDMRIARLAFPGMRIEEPAFSPVWGTRRLR